MADPKEKILALATAIPLVAGIMWARNNWQKAQPQFDAYKTGEGGPSGPTSFYGVQPTTFQGGKPQSPPPPATAGYCFAALTQPWNRLGPVVCFATTDLRAQAEANFLKQWPNGVITREFNASTG